MRVAGGDDVFPELAVQSLGRNRIIADPLEVPRRAPDIILGSWCGKKFQPAQVAARPGWADVPAIRGGFVREIKSPIILQPGPAALTDGVRAIQEVIVEWAERRPVSHARARDSMAGCAMAEVAMGRGYESPRFTLITS